MIIIPKGTDPNTINESTIAFDKLILEGHEKNWPAGQPEPKGIQDIRNRIAKYEAENGVVDPEAISKRQEDDFQNKLTVLEGLAKMLRPNG